MTKSKDVTVIIHPAHDGDMHAKPPLSVNGVNYPYVLGKETTLPDFVVEVAERSDSLRVERTDGSAPAQTIDPGPASNLMTSDGRTKDEEVEAQRVDEAPAAKSGSDGAAGGAGVAAGGNEPPALSHKTKDELIAIANDEGADLTKASNNDDRIAAIEKNRKAQAKKA